MEPASNVKSQSRKRQNFARNNEPANIIGTSPSSEAMDAANWATLLKKALPAEITRLRTDRGLSKNEVSVRTGLARSFVTEIEQGKTNPSIESLARIAYALGISPSSLLKEVEKNLSAVPRFTEEDK